MKTSDDPLQQLLLRILLHLGRSIRRRRRRLGLSQEMFSSVSGISISELKFVEAGDRNVTLGIMLRICLSLDGSSVGEIMYETERRLMEDEEGLFLWRSVLKTLRDLINGVPRLSHRSCE